MQLNEKENEGDTSMQRLTFGEYKIYKNRGLTEYRAVGPRYHILFIVEQRNGGVYFNITNVYDSTTDRTYKSPRYTNKFMQTVREMAHVVVTNNL